MDVKQAAATAKQYVADLLADEGLTNLGLEEIEFDDSAESWNVILGFSRPWNSVHNALTDLTGGQPRRSYQAVRIRDSDGRVLSVTRRDPVS